MKREVWFILLIVIVLFMGVWFVTNSNNTVSTGETSKISLNYQAVKEYSPDIAEIILGIETINEDIESALNENHKKIEDIKEALKQISGLQISTANYRVTPKENYNEDDKKISSHRVVNLLSVKITDLEIINRVIDNSLNAGANSVNRIEYDLKNRKEAKNEVIKEALKGIQNKADFVTQNLDKKKNKIISLNLNDSSGRNVVYETQDKLASPQRGPGIKPDKIKIKVNVRATYKVSS